MGRDGRFFDNWAILVAVLGPSFLGPQTTHFTAAMGGFGTPMKVTTYDRFFGNRAQVFFASSPKTAMGGQTPPLTRCITGTYNTQGRNGIPDEHGIETRRVVVLVCLRRRRNGIPDEHGIETYTR